MTLIQDRHERGLALDRASVRRVDADGHLHVAMTPISKAVVNPYYGREIPSWQSLGLDGDRMYRLYRDPAELEKAAPSFNGKPLFMGHRPVSAVDHDHENNVGSVTNATWQPPYLMAALDIWPKTAIDAIEAEEHSELSSAYRYRPDMTPGRTPDGEAYDGVMRDIDGSHVALVPKGRAGSDVRVQDSAPPLLKELFPMAIKTAVPSRAAAMAQGALMVYLRPKLAQDAKLDLGPMLKGITAKNFASKKATIAADVKKSVEGKLAKDADVSDVVELLDALEEMTPEEVEEAKEQAGAADESEEDKKAREAKEAKAKSEKDEDDNKKDDDVKAAQDAAIAAAVEKAKAGMVSKTAMDEALKAVKAEQIAIREAEQFVEPWAGKLSVAMDSVESVHRAALDVLGVKHDGKHPDALRDIIEAQRKPGEKVPPMPRIAQDANAANGFADRYPEASRIRSL